MIKNILLNLLIVLGVFIFYSGIVFIALYIKTRRDNHVDKKY